MESRLLDHFFKQFSCTLDLRSIVIIVICQPYISPSALSTIASLAQSASTVSQLMISCITHLLLLTPDRRSQI